MRWLPIAAAAAVLALAPPAALAAWSAPVRVSPPDGALHGAPSAALGADGEAVAAWLRRPARAVRGAARVQVAERPAGARAWRAPRTLSGPGASAPEAALGPRGRAVVAWANGRVVMGAVRGGPQARWSPRRVAETAGAVGRLAVAVDRRGTATVLWSERRGGGQMVRLATRSSARAAWAVREARLAVPGRQAPALALSPGRGALAAWVQDDRVRASRTAGGAFERPVELSEEHGATPGAAIGAGGGALAAWSVRLPGGTPVLMAAARTAAGDRWGAPEDLGIGMEPVAAIGEGGDAVVAWGVAGRGQEQGVEAATRRGGGAWRSTTVVPRGACECRLVAGAAAVDPSGASIVSWRREGPDGRVAGGVAALPRGGDRWVRPPREPGRAAGAPAVAVGPEPGALAVWAREGPGGGVRAVSLDGGGAFGFGRGG